MRPGVVDDSGFCLILILDKILEDTKNVNFGTNMCPIQNAKGYVGQERSKARRLFFLRDIPKNREPI